MRITRDREAFKLSQEEYVKKVLSRFNMTGVKPVSTPLACHFQLSKDQSSLTEEEWVYMTKVPYAFIIGSLTYAMVCTRPDIAHVVGVVSRYMSNWGKQYQEAMKWILRYLRGTIESTLYFRKSNIGLQGYVDADMVGDIDRRKSTIRYVYTLGDTVVSWVLKLQKIVALPITKAKYVAMTKSNKEMMWLQSFLEELGHKYERSMLHCDNHSVIHLAKNPIYHARTKHIQVWHHFIKSALEDGVLTLERFKGIEIQLIC